MVRMMVFGLHRIYNFLNFCVVGYKNFIVTGALFLNVATGFDDLNLIHIWT